MESIIIWIVIIAIGFVYDWAKKKHESSEEVRHKPDVSSRPAPCNASWAKHTPLHYTATDNGTPQQSSQTKERKGTSASAISHSYTPIANIVENDCTLQVEELEGNLEMNISNTPSQQDNVAYHEHYNRWRKAIIDTQILERKF